MNTRGTLTTCSSKILYNYKPVYNATVVERLGAEGDARCGKTNLDEFAMGSSTENSAFFVTHNPWDLDKVPGGSSGGSAAAVAADECAVRARFRHRRLHPAAGGFLRGRRDEADLRPRLALWADRVRLLARPDRADHQGCHRLRPGDERDLGQGPAWIRPRWMSSGPILPSRCATMSRACGSACRRSSSARAPIPRWGSPSGRRSICLPDSGPSRARPRCPASTSACRFTI